MAQPLNASRPCPTCKGTGVIVVAATRGGKKVSEKHTCPTCRGSKQSSGLATK